MREKVSTRDMRLAQCAGLSFKFAARRAQRSWTQGQEIFIEIIRNTLLLLFFNEIFLDVFTMPLIKLV